MATIDILARVARAVESVVPDLALMPYIGDDIFFESDEDLPEGEWSRSLGFSITYRGEWCGGCENATTGSESERVSAAVQELLSQIQDVISVATTEPWPLVMRNGRREIIAGNVIVFGDELQMWYGNRDVPSLRIPAVSLT